MRIRPTGADKRGDASVIGAAVKEKGPFNAVFGTDSSQHSVYAVCGSPLLDGLFDEGLSGCLFAFGATGGCCVPP